MEAQEIFNKAIETLADQYELFLNGFIDDTAWFERRTMTYFLIDSLTGKTQKEAMEALQQEAVKRNLKH